MHKTLLCLVAAVALAPPVVMAQVKLLDDFENLAGWQLIASDGVRGKTESAPGHAGNAMAIDFEFHAGSGYAIAQKRIPLELPANYKFTFFLRGDTPGNNFEFKLLDSLGNVYWIKQLNLEYPRAWKKRTIKKRHLTFAWGPAGGGMPAKIDRMEFVVSAGSGGKGTIYVDELRFEPIDDSLKPSRPAEIKVSSAKKGPQPWISAGGEVVKNWTSAGKSEREWLVINFQKEVEVGGLVIDWHQHDFATAYEVELSDDGNEWYSGHAVVGGNGGRDYIYLPEAEAKFLRLNLRRSSRGQGYGLAQLEVKAADFSSSANAFFNAIAVHAPRGYFPKHLLQQQTYWTIVGVSGDTKEALINENGAIEVAKAGFSLEPFLYRNQRLVTWNDVALKQSLEQNYLPIPSVHWEDQGLQLHVTAFAAGEAGNSVLIAAYLLENKTAAAAAGKLFVALRPFQVLPPWQELNIIGGVSRLDSVRYVNSTVFANQDKRLMPVQAPNGFGAATFDQGDITEYLQKGVLPPNPYAKDVLGFASAALAFDFNLAPAASQKFELIVPLHDGEQGSGVANGKWQVEQLFHDTKKFWEAKLDQVEIRLPAFAQPIVDCFKSQLAYILINRDGPAIQPGSRTYERAWIRDGSLTSAAMLQTGNSPEVREYLDWYAPHQYPSGKVPCVVDTRGADPVPEHDSHGQLIYAMMEYFHFTRDTTWLREKFPYVVNAVRYIQTLRRERMTDTYRHGTPEQRACFGLVPESISHEGYSAKPMHSYWDDFFILRGLKDATQMAGILHENTLAQEFAAELEDFRNCLYVSLRLAMANKNIDFIPGCVELGDFDATSTTVGVSPVNELGNLPEPELQKTFAKYFEYFDQRRHNAIDWINYTPYETRLMGTFILLDQKERAHELLDFFLKDRRPPGWNHWAEVVWRDPATPKMIGDMPHTWVGSDFMRSLRSFFVYEREKDQALVVAAGIPEKWVRDPAGIAVKNLHTYYGTLDYRMQMHDGTLHVELGGNLHMPPGKIVLKSPFSSDLKAVVVNGKKSKAFNAKEVRVNVLPARVTMSVTR